MTDGLLRDLQTAADQYASVGAMRVPDDPYPDVLSAVVRAKVDGDESAAFERIEQIAFVAPERLIEKDPPITVIAQIYARDKYHCRYCGERVILTAVMRLISDLYPEVFPYNQNWRAESTHPAFITRSATLDHVEPRSTGGHQTDVANLVTACWGCNRRKGNMSLEDLGWTLLPIRDSFWTGLTDLYRPLWEAAGEPVLGGDRMAWMRASEKANAAMNEANR